MISRCIRPLGCWISKGRLRLRLVGFEAEREFPVGISGSLKEVADRSERDFYPVIVCKMVRYFRPLFALPPHGSNGLKVWPERTGPSYGMFLGHSFFIHGVLNK